MRSSSISPAQAMRKLPADRQRSWTCPDASAEEKDEEINEMLKEENQANFVRFEGLDHMTSFNYAYDLSAVRDWLFAQSK